ncbi:cobaltochelatase subunit CobN [Olivibacter sp. SDN3]|uniref:cobaltochelatase subunit CobN n=1 Tax=Olivibacter sp. SDN3 TaxID=2764720 RepID=UPI0016514B8F|nr:cobaltochelatase subunit CobN [Olivibacter sp. SDN3]QNL49640.1 cobaltochelatase subunit CobN [Olivibacter sp. SDN3]
MKRINILYALLLAGLYLLMPLLGLAESVKPRKIVFLVSENYSKPLAQAIQGLEELPEFAERYQILTANDSSLDFAEIDLAVCYLHTPAMMQRFGPGIKQMLAKETAVYAVGETPEAGNYQKQGIQFDAEVAAYFDHPSPSNLTNLILLLTKRHFDSNYPVQPLVPFPESGIVAMDGTVYRSFSEYSEKMFNGRGADRPLVGLYMFRYEAVTQQFDHIKAYAVALDTAGFEPLLFYGHPLEQAIKQYCLNEDSTAMLSALLNFSSLPGSSDDRLRTAFSQLGVPVINAIGLAEAAQEWQASTLGISLAARAMVLARPELSGQIQPTIATTMETIEDAQGTEYTVKKAPTSRINRLVGRVKAWSRLQELPNEDKKIALVYYNGHPGKHNIGASYLNVLPQSMSTILGRLTEENYDLGGTCPPADTVFQAVMRGGRNIGTWAPAELDRLVRETNPVLIPMETYTSWFKQLHPKLQAHVTAKWGAPETSRIMTWQRSDGKKFFVLPRVRYGNINLMPQPARGWEEDTEALFHDVTLPPHHQYIAFYLYLQHGFHADAVIHLGTHGTHEWLSGREAGFDDDDAPEALIGNLVNIYPYIMDNVGEGTQAKRRGMAVIIDHLTPPFDQAALRPDLRDLAGAINDYDVAMAKSPALADIHLKTINRLAKKANLHQDMGITGDFKEEDIQELEHYLQDINSNLTPMGMHTFGKSPDSLMAMKTAEAIVSRMQDIPPESRDTLLHKIYQRIVVSGAREMDALITALNGKYIAAGSGNDPIRNPDALPTGKNFYSFDPSRMPTEDTYRTGRELAEQLIVDYQHQHDGQFPDKITINLWSVETVRHEGIMESQILALLGVKPVYDGFGRIKGIEGIPNDSLDRPRVDVVITPSGLYRDMFPNMVLLLDEAVNLAYQQGGQDNFVRQHVEQIKTQLLAAGVQDTALAERLATVRLFGTASGTYGTGVNDVIQASDRWNDEQEVSDVYFNRMGHLYGQGFWGENIEGATMPESAKELTVSLFKEALSGTKAVVHSRSTNVYGALDNDDFFQYLGGMAMAVRQVDGTTPDILVTNLTDPGTPKQETLEKFIGREMNSRYLNPKWVQKMLDEGYAGARMVSRVADNMWGWQVTAPEVIDAQKWEQWFDTYVADQYDLQIKDQFEKAGNLYAYQTMLARMLEVVRKEYWKPDDESLDKLVEEYLQTADKVGLSCADNVCGNESLTEFVKEVAQHGGSKALLDDLIEGLGRIRQSPSNSASTNLPSNVSGNTRPMPQANTSPVKEGQQEAVAPISGYKMEEVSQEASTAEGGQQAKINTLEYLMLIIGLCSLMIAGFIFGRKY